MPKSIYDDGYRLLIGLLRDARIKAKLTQHNVARKMGKQQSFVAKVEGCERRLDVVEFVDLCHAIGAEPANLLGSIDWSKDRT